MKNQIDRRTLLRSGGAAGAMLALPATAFAATSAHDPKLATLFDTLFLEGVRQRPESATLLGLDTGPNADLRSKLSDASEVGRAAARALTASQIRRLAAIDRRKLSPADRLNYDVVLYARRAAAAGDRFDYAGNPYVISQQNGAYQSTPDFLDTKHPLNNAGDAEAWLSRLAAFAGQLDANTARFTRDAAAKVLPADFLLDLTLTQLGKLNLPAKDARLIQSFAARARARGLPDSYATNAAALYDAQVLPALARQFEAVKAARAQATHDAGVWKLKDGDAFYRMALRNATTTRLSPQEVHKFGLDQAAAIIARMDAIMRKQGMTSGTVGQRLQAIHDLPGQVFPNTDAGKADAIAYCNARLAAIRERLPRVFRRIPPYKFEVRRVPPETEAGAASAFSQGPAIDGSRPGYVYFNLMDSGEWPKFMLPTVIYHEGLPGHQFEGGLALSNDDLPLIRKASGFSGYAEGWALYAEQLADEIGMYDDDPLGQLGYLKEQLFRAHRCIIDTGLHHYRWSREKAIDLFVTAQGETPGFATREIDRYCVNPGQACSYKLGHSTFVAIRDKAQRLLGPRYDIKDYHEAVLAGGRLPLEILQAQGDAWIAGRMRG
ncbi:MAG TPA: DUF885 family protein [Sphingomonas sp.]|nr:DUF885 family protein [Sphingomonas sp.]